MGTQLLSNEKMKFLLIIALCIAGALARKTERIVGGSNVGYAGKYPWQASLQFRSSSSHTSGASSYKIVLGLHDRTTRRQGDPRDYTISRITSHPGWSNDGSRGFPNYISVIYLSSTVFPSQYVSAISLPFTGQSFVGQSF